VTGCQQCQLPTHPLSPLQRRNARPRPISHFRKPGHHLPACPPAAPHPSLTSDKGAKKKRRPGFAIPRLGSNRNRFQLSSCATKEKQAYQSITCTWVGSRLQPNVGRNHKRDLVLKLPELRATVYLVLCSTVGSWTPVTPLWLRLSKPSREKLLVGQTKTRLHNDVTE
jgi:hypothetical protein